MNDDTADFLYWSKGFSMDDDGLAAWQALKALEAVRFELTMREEGYLGRIQEAVDNA